MCRSPSIRYCWWTSSSSRSRPAWSLSEAVLEAGAVRFRPIELNAAAVVVGGVVMVSDPILQGLAVAPMSGAVVADAAHDDRRADALPGVAATADGGGTVPRSGQFR